MRSTVLACSAFAPFLLAGCSSASVADYEDPVGQVESPIVFGTKDTTHTAVVAILADAGGNGFDECSGSIVQVTNSEGYVLTAAHCCGGDPQNPNITPSLVIMANDYGPYENYIGNPNPPSPSFAVVAGSVKWDPAYNGQDHDFCMLRFKGASANTPTIMLPASANDGLSVGVNVEYVGYGVTVGAGNNNSLRYHATAPVNQAVTSLVIKYSEGNGVGGPCEGDSGGPALLPAGAAQAQQTVVATTSYGDQTCAQFGVSSRVSSEIGAGKFITTYLANGGSSSSSSSSSGAGGGNAGTCDSCQQTVLAQGGTCYPSLQTCGNDADCANIVNCQNNCAANDSACADNCFAMYPNGQADYNAIVACICNQGCVSQCSVECGGSGSGGASASSTGAGVGVGPGATTGASGVTGATGVGVGGAGATSGAGNPTATTGSNGFSAGAGGDDSTDTLRSNNQPPGCGCVQAGDSAPGSTEAFGGLFVAAAIAMSRRRRSR